MGLEAATTELEMTNALDGATNASQKGEDGGASLATASATHGMAETYGEAAGEGPAVPQDG